MRPDEVSSSLRDNGLTDLVSRKSPRSYWSSFPPPRPTPSSPPPVQESGGVLDWLYADKWPEDGGF